MLENRFYGVGQIGAESFNGVVSTDSLPASAAEVYIAFARFSPGQVELMKALIIHKDPGRHGAEVGTSIASSDEFDFKNVLETAIGGIMKGNVAREEATLLLEYFRLYKESFSSGQIPIFSDNQSESKSITEPTSAMEPEIRGSTVDGEPATVDEKPHQSRTSGGKLISEFLSEYIEFLQQGHAESYVRDTRSAFKWLIGHVGDLAVDSVEVKTLEQLFAAEYGRKSHNAARFYRTLKAAFGKARKWKYIDKNPFEDFNLPRVPETVVPYVDESDLDKLTAQKLTSDYKELYTFTARTGLRLSEVLNLKWDSVDLVNNLITVTNYKGYRTKSKKIRQIPIEGKLADLVHEIHSRIPPGKNPVYFFERRGKKFNANYASRLFKSTIRLAGLDEKLHFHSLRHGFASQLLHNNVNPVHVQKLMGHANIATTLKYMHPEEDDLRKAVRTLGRSEGDQP